MFDTTLPHLVASLAKTYKQMHQDIENVVSKTVQNCTFMHLTNGHVFVVWPVWPLASFSYHNISDRE